MSGAAPPRRAHADMRTSLPPHALKFLSMIHLAHVVAAAHGIGDGGHRKLLDGRRMIGVRADLKKAIVSASNYNWRCGSHSSSRRPSPPPRVIRDDNRGIIGWPRRSSKEDRCRG